MTYTAYFLKFITPLHLSDYKPDSYETSESFLRSDTIIAAIMASWAKKGLEGWIGDGDLPFTVSSAFPFYQEKDKDIVMFLPRPKLPFNNEDEDGSISKELKKVKWIDKNLFESVISGKSFSIKSSLQGDFLSTSNVNANFMIRQVSERVTIPRDRSIEESRPFYMERIYFNDAGLYFLATGDHLDRINTALDLLQHEGIGTDRNVGNGFFTYTNQEIQLNVPQDTKYYMSLGLYCPDSKENLEQELDEKSAYDLIKRGGYITKEGYQTIEKYSIYMMAEGSILKTNKPIHGKPNIDLTPIDLHQNMRPNHPIYRCGRTIFIPVKV
jgi:CRISPR-associated protein Csm4